MQPTPYERQADFSGFSASNPTRQQRGSDLDAEFDAIGTSLGEVLRNLALIQRDDGAVINGSVGIDQLDNAVMTLLAGRGFNVRGQWVTSTAYSLGDLVTDGGVAYLVSVVHTSSVLAVDLAAGKLVRIFDSATSLAALLASSAGASEIGHIDSGTGAVARTLIQVLQDYTHSVKAYGAAGDGVTDDTAAFDRAGAANREYFVPPGTFNLGSMHKVDAHGVGGRTLRLSAGTTLTRVGTGNLDPLIWLGNDDCAIIGAGQSSIVGGGSGQAQDVDGILVGHRDLATSGGVNVRWCQVQNLKIRGKTARGKTLGSPTRGLVICSSQVGGLVSFFNFITNIWIEQFNIGLEFQGDANSNHVLGIGMQYIGNPSLSSYRAGVRFNGGLENTVLGYFLHDSVDSYAVEMLDCDNTANGGILTAPTGNVVIGKCEQDPSPSAGKGLVVSDLTCTGVDNDIQLFDNCSGNAIGSTFWQRNRIKLIGSESLGRWVPHHASNAAAVGAGLQPNARFFNTTVGALSMVV